MSKTLAFSLLFLSLALVSGVVLNNSGHLLSTPSDRAVAALHSLTQPAPELSAPKFAFTLLSYYIEFLEFLASFVPPPIRAFDLTFGFGKTQAVAAFAKLGIFEALADAGGDGLTLEQIVAFIPNYYTSKHRHPNKNVNKNANTNNANTNNVNTNNVNTNNNNNNNDKKEIKIEQDRIHRMLEFGKNIDLVDFDPFTKKWYITSLGACFVQKNNEGSMTPMVFHNADEIDLAWRSLPESIIENTSGFNVFAKKDVWQFYKDNPVASDNFDLAMRSISLNFVPTLLLEYESHITAFAKNLSRPVHVCDVGGGIGSILVSLVKLHPDVTGTVLDLEGPIANAKKYIQQHNLSSRVDAVVQDFFKPISVQCDIYILKHIIHDWNDADSIKILSAIAKTAPRHSKLLLIENVLGTRTGFSEKMKRNVDMQMLAVFGDSKERTLSEYIYLLDKSGFVFSKSIPSRGLFDIVEATPIRLGA